MNNGFDIKVAQNSIHIREKFSKEKNSDFIKGLSYELPIADVFTDNIFKIFLEYCTENNIQTIDQLTKFDFNKLDKLKGFGSGKKKKLINKYFEVINEGDIKIEPRKLFNLLMSDIKEKKNYDVLRRRAIDNETLQQVGKYYGISRERVRQKEIKVVRAIEGLLNLFINISNENEVKLDSIEGILGIENLSCEERQCLTYVLKNNEMYNKHYIEEIDKFLINGSIDEYRNKVYNLSNDMPEIVEINTELKYYIKKYDELSIFTLNEIVKLILTCEYKRVNNYLFKGCVSKTKIYNFIVKEFFQNGIIFSNDEDIEKFIYILKEKFHIEDYSIRNIKAKIETNCVLCDRGGYIHPHRVKIDGKMLRDIRTYIDNNTNETIYLHQIYSVFEDKLNKYGV